MNKSERKKTMMIKCAVAAAVMLVVTAGIVVIMGRGETRINRLLDLGEKYLEDMDYESAALVFDQAIAIDPKCEEAYLGKAQALYALGKYEGIITTLEEGIRNVDDSSRLEEFLQQLMDEITDKESSEIDSGEIETEKRLERDLALNYIEIVRLVDTQEPEIQLEILGDEEEKGEYIWTSSDPECASVSQEGLITCQPVEGAAVIYAEDSYGNKSDGCVVRIYSSAEGAGVNKSETVRIRMNAGEEGKEQDFAVLLVEKEGQEQVLIDVLGNYIYYSGDIVIPERLQFKGRELVVTGISRKAFRWGDELNTVCLPDTLESVGDQEYEVENPFYFCKNLKEIKAGPDNVFLKTVDGALYSKDGRILYSYPAGKSADSYTLPKEVEMVCAGAFLGCSNLKEILVEEGNGYYVSVDGCLIEKEKKQMVAYPIGNGLTSFIVPDIVKHLDSNVFYSSILEEIDCNSVEDIYDDAFRQCNALERIKGGEKTANICWYSDKAVAFTGIDSMQNLKYMYITLSEEQDMGEFAGLKNLDRMHIEAGGLPVDFESLNGSSVSTLEINGMGCLEDLSWVEGMKALQSIRIMVKEFKVTDLTPLLHAGGLKYVDIDCGSSDREELNDDIKRQIEEIKLQRPEMNIKIWE